jgi:hypothetical protein
MEDNSLSEYLLNFKILYNCVQTMHKNCKHHTGFYTVMQDFRQKVLLLLLLLLLLTPYVGIKMATICAWNDHLDVQ